MTSRTKAIVCGSFDNLSSRDVRYLEAASKAGELYVLLWSDEAARRLDARPTRFPEEERLYLVQAIRYVSKVRWVRQGERDVIAQIEEVRPDIWVVTEANDTPVKRAFCLSRGLEYRVLSSEDLKGFGAVHAQDRGVDEDATRCTTPTSRRRVLVSGCFDWLHSGHVRFFEEVSQLGDLYVVVGHDANVRLLKGEPHPLLAQEERRYMVQAIRHVKQALISTGRGWLDAEPEIASIKPDIYAVNEDGDVPVKREFCRARGIEYVVLRREPKPGLPRRQSTNLRGF